MAEPTSMRSGHVPPGLDTTEMRSMSDRRTSPPSPVAQRAGKHPLVTSGAATMVVGVLLVATSAIVFGDAIALRPSSEPLGPAAFPLIIAVLLALVGIALVVSNRRSALVLARNITREGAPQLARVLILLGSIVVYALVLPIAGFTVTSALLFTVAARLLGSTHRWRLPLYGIVISGLITLLFDRLIGLALPAGPWGF